MSRLRHEKGARAGAGSGVYRLQADKPLPFKPDEERKCGGKIGGKNPAHKLGRKRGGKVEHGTDAFPDRGEKLATKVSHDDGFEHKRGGPVACRKDGGKVKWVQNAVKHPGALHKDLGVAPGKKIPEKKLEKAEHSKDSTVRHRAQFAETAKHFHHSKKD